MNELLASMTRQLPHAIRLLGQMVNMESPSLDKALVDKFARFIGSRFEEIGGQVDYVPADRFGDHVRVRFGRKSNDRILLLGHIDTVWPAGEALKRPFAVDAGKATGPGVFDMKAGILLAWMAMRALQQRGGTTKNVTVVLNSDEETGSNSSRSLIESEARQCGAVLVVEPSLPGGVLKTTRKGVGRFTVKTIGRAAHAGIDPSSGVNAVEELARQIIKLHSMNDAERGTTVTVGVVQGGTRSNVVPAEAAAEVDVRIASIEEAARITNALKALTPELPGARLEVRGSIDRPPMERTADSDRLFDVARKVAARMGIDLQQGSTGGASDGNFTSALGVPTLDGLGAIGDGAHATHEWVDTESLPLRAALLAELIEAV